MGWLFRDRRGLNQGWTEQTLASISTTPSPLLAIVGIVGVLIVLSSYTNYKSQMQRTRVGFDIFLLFLPVLLIFVAYMVTKYGRFPILSPSTKATVVHQPEGTASPWHVALFLVLLLVLLSCQSHFQSKWWPHWGYY